MGKGKLKGKADPEVEKVEEMPSVSDSTQELPPGESTETPKNKPGRKPKLKGKSGDDPKPSEETIKEDTVVETVETPKLKPGRKSKIEDTTGDVDSALSEIDQESAKETQPKKGSKKGRLKGKSEDIPVKSEEAQKEETLAVTNPAEEVQSVEAEETPKR